MLGPDLTVRGGMSSVEKILLERLQYSEKLHIEFIPTHRELSKIGKLIFAGSSYVRFLGHLMTKRTDVVYIHISADAGFFRKSLFAITGSVLGKRIVMHMHGGYFEDFYRSSSRTTQKYIKYVMEHTDKIIVLTEEWKNFYRRFVEKDIFTVISNGVEVGRNKYNPQGTFITFMGMLNKKKGVYDILDIVREVVVQYPGVRFVLAGNGDIQKVKQTAIDRDLGDFVSVPGWISEKQIEEVLSETVIYLLPSYAEGLPMSVLEAMAYGIPVIASDVGGLHEVIATDENGILIEPGDKLFMKNSILRLLGQKELRMKLSHNGHQTVKDKFSANIFAQKVEDVLLS